MLVIEEHVVLHKAELSGEADSENNHGGSSMTTMNYTGSKAHLAVPASAGAADGADEEPCLRTADGNRRGVQQTTAAQGELLPGTALRERGGSSEHTAAVEAQPGDDRALSEDRVRSG